MAVIVHDPCPYGSDYLPVGLRHQAPVIGLLSEIPDIHLQVLSPDDGLRRGRNSFRYEDGAMGSVMLSEISPGRGNRLAIEITCEDGNLWWNEEENNVLHTAVRGEGIRSEIFAFGNGFNDTFVSLMKNFYEGRDYPTFREGAQIVEVCEAIRTSAENGSAWTEV